MAAAFEVPDGADAGPTEHEHAQANEPPGFPEMGQHDEGRRRAGFVPQPLAVASNHMELIAPGRHIAVIGRAPGSCFDPGWIEPLQAVTKPDPLRGAKAQARVTKFQPVHAWCNSCDLGGRAGVGANRPSGRWDAKSGALRLAVDEDIFEQYRGRGVGHLLPGIHDHDAFGSAKPELSGTGL